MVDWTPERDLLTTIVDVLNQLHATLIAVNSEGGKRPDFKAMPRPYTAIGQVERDIAYEEHLERVRQFLPNRQ